MSDETKVPRYEIIVAEGGGENVYQHPDGWWCAADDVARLEAENARMREWLDATEKLRESRAEVDRLRALVVRLDGDLAYLLGRQSRPDLAHVRGWHDATQAALNPKPPAEEAGE